MMQEEEKTATTKSEEEGSPFLLDSGIEKQGRGRCERCAVR